MVLSNVGGAIGHVSTFRASLGYGGWKEPQHAGRGEQVPWAWDGFVRGEVIPRDDNYEVKTGLLAVVMVGRHCRRKVHRSRCEGLQDKGPTGWALGAGGTALCGWKPRPKRSSFLFPNFWHPSVVLRAFLSVLSKVFPFPNSATSLRPQTFISSFVKGTEMKLMWPNGCWTGHSVPLF